MNNYAVGSYLVNAANETYVIFLFIPDLYDGDDDVNVILLDHIPIGRYQKIPENSKTVRSSGSEITRTEYLIQTERFQRHYRSQRFKHLN